MLEVVLESKDDFASWLEQHNDNRRMDYISDDDFIKENEEEFDLIPLDLLTFKKYYLFIFLHLKSKSL